MDTINKKKYKKAETPLLVEKRETIMKPGNFLFELDSNLTKVLG